MKVILGNKAGFCMGVRKAMDTISSLPFNKNEIIYSDGPIIHNPQVIEALKKRNIVPLTSGIDLKGKTVIVRTHGILPERRAYLKKAGALLLDVTCPRVRQIQKIIEKKKSEGYGIIVFGDSEHSEVKALLGYAGKDGIALSSWSDKKKIPLFSKVAVVSQSTKNIDDYRNFTEHLKKNYSNIEIFDTLCNSTTCRQAESIELAKDADAIVVVGGYDSANTRTLATVAAQSGKPVFHIETEKELNPKDFNGFSTVALTAGASTPNWMINRVYQQLIAMKGKDESWASFIFRKIGNFLVFSTLFVSVSTVFLSYAASKLMGVTSGWRQYIIAPLYIYSMHILNIFVDFKSIEISQPSRANFFRKYRIVLIPSAILSVIGAVVAASTLRPETLLIILIAVFLGLIYSVPILPEHFIKKLRFLRMRDIPGSKDLLVAGAWGAMTVLIHPLSKIGLKVSAPSSIAAFLWVFGMVTSRMIVNDIRYLHGDAVIGQGTIPVLIGPKATKKILKIISIFISLLLISSVLTGYLVSVGLFLLIPLVYSLFYQSLLYRRKIKSDIAFEITMDLELLICGAVAFGWNHIFS